MDRQTHAAELTIKADMVHQVLSDWDETVAQMIRNVRLHRGPTLRELEFPRVADELAHWCPRERM
jgi:hypothetical protein